MPWTDYPWFDTPAGATPILASVLKSEFSRAALHSEPYVVAAVSPAATATANTAALNAACASLATTKGTVLVPAGFFPMNGQITRKAYVSIKGMGRLATTLNWDADLGAGQYAITTDEPAETRMHSWVSDIGLTGPDIAPAVGVAPAAMYGVKLNNRSNLSNVRLSGFYAGAVITENHQVLRDVFAAGNYYGLYYGPGGGTFGDQFFSYCVLDTNSFSSVAVHPNNGSEAGLWNSCHFGFSPYCFYREAGTTTRDFISNSVFIDPNFEGFGNGVIYGENTTDSLGGLTFLAMGAGQDVTFKLAARAFESHVKVGLIDDVKMYGAGIFSDTPTNSVVQVTGDTCFGLYLESAGTILSEVVSATVPILRTTATPFNCRYSAGDHAGRMIVANNNFTVGDVVKFGSLATHASTYTAGAVPYGVAASTVTASAGEACVCVALAGQINTAFTTAPTNGEFAEADQANLGKAVDAAAPSRYTIGVWKQSGGSGTGRLYLRGLGW